MLNFHVYSWHQGMSNADVEISTQTIFDLIGKHADLDVLLQAVTAWIEERIPDAVVSVMLYDAATDSISLKRDVRFSEAYFEALQNAKIGPDVGTCGAAAFERKLRITPDIFQDPNWRLYADLAKAEGLAACWSAPVIGAQGNLYGTFATYYRKPKQPTDAEIQLIQRAASLVALAFAHQQERAMRLRLNERYASLFRNHPDIVFELDCDGLVVAANASIEKVSGFTETQMIGHHYCEFISEASRLIAGQAFAKVLAGEAQNYEVFVKHASGNNYWLDITNLPIIIDEEVIGVFGIGRDITQRKRIDEQLRLLKRGIEASPHGIVLADASSKDMPLVYVNPAFTAITGYAEEEVLGTNCRFLQGEDTDPEAIAAIRRALKHRQELQVTIRNYRKDGSWFWNQLILGPVLDEQGQCTHYFGIQQDITRQREYEDLIATQNTQDALTGLMNRNSFENRLVRESELTKGGRSALTIMCINLDDFSSLNQSLGHQIGDKILVAVADRLSFSVTDNDVLARLAADEFAVMCSTSSAAVAIDYYAERLLKILARPFDIDGYQIHISASIGISEVPKSVDRVLDGLKQAVIAVDEAKRQGRNTWAWYRHQDSLLGIDYATMRRDLMEAIDDEQFELYYQPQVTVDNQRVETVEALIRWQHPQRGWIAPLDFIPLAEKTGQIIAIGQWVLQRACLDIAKWNAEHQNQLSLAVNISPLQFRRTGFLEQVKNALKVSKLEPSRLELEVTESVLMFGAERTIEILNQLRELGVKISIDDFGTGYSSLSYLRALPVDKLKLDRSFIQHLPENKKDGAIVRGLITMAHHLDLAVVAEGVETEQQVTFLREQDCNVLQGFYFAKPAPLNELQQD